MKVQLAPGWQTELDHGPDWLFVKLYGPHGEDADTRTLAVSLHVLLDEESARRMVLELDEVEAISADFVHELLDLYDRLGAKGRLLRVCGVSCEHQKAIREVDCLCRLPQFRDRKEAVMGFHRPGKPR